VANVLLEIALGMNLVKVLPVAEPDSFVFGKTGWFLLEDRMTRVNFSFVTMFAIKERLNLQDH